ncbi:MAG: nucleotidyltransferase domain-containing protein [Ignavibacteria bacterium]|nr:nucleotidyltransferase domain-containing protein [Ignavibacteria bacterium]
MNFGLTDNDVQTINNIFRKFDTIDKVVIYGSRAKGSFKPGSDIDLIMEGNNLNLTLLNKVSSMLHDLPIPYIVDLSIKNKIEKKELLEHINRVGKVFYQK